MTPFLIEDNQESHLEVQVDDEVVVIRHVGLVPLHAELGLTPCHLRQLRQTLEGVQVAELDDLNGHRQLAAAESADQLGIIHDADKFVTGL